MIVISIGDTYPLPLPFINDGEACAAAQFLLKDGNALQIILSGMSAREEAALQSGTIRAGLLYKNGAMLFLFEFYDEHNIPILIFEAPFDARLLPTESLNLNDIDDVEQRLGIMIHCIDEKKIVRALRFISMPPTMTLKFLDFVKDQLTEVRPGTNEMSEWQSLSLDNLIKTTDTWILGK